MLEFETKAEMDETLNNILKGQTKIADFRSLMDLFNEAMDEMDAINSKEEAEQFKIKYAPYFLFNNTDSEDYCHYIPMENRLYANVANINGDVKIGGKVVNLIDLKKFEDSNMFKSAAETRAIVAEGDNSVKMYINNNKMWADAYRVGSQVWIDFVAQRYRLWGWNHYSEFYYYKVLDIPLNKPGDPHFINTQWDNFSYSVLMASMRDWGTTNRVKGHSHLFVGNGLGYYKGPDKIYYSRVKFLVTCNEMSGSDMILNINI